MLLNMSYHSADYGAILFEMIGQISISLDGVAKHEMDLAKLLAELPPEGA